MHLSGELVTTGFGVTVCIHKCWRGRTREKFGHTSLTLGSERLSSLGEDVGSADTSTWDVLRVDEEDERGAWALGVGRESCMRWVAMGGEGEEYDGMVKYWRIFLLGALIRGRKTEMRDRHEHESP
jgi:hypothetical protein